MFKGSWLVSLCVLFLLPSCVIRDLIELEREICSKPIVVDTTDPAPTYAALQAGQGLVVCGGGDCPLVRALNTARVCPNRFGQQEIIIPAGTTHLINDEFVTGKTTPVTVSGARLNKNVLIRTDAPGKTATIQLTTNSSPFLVGFGSASDITLQDIEFRDGRRSNVLVGPGKWTLENVAFRGFSNSTLMDIDGELTGRQVEITEARNRVGIISNGTVTLAAPVVRDSEDIALTVTEGGTMILTQNSARRGSFTNLNSLVFDIGELAQLNAEAFDVVNAKDVRALAHLPGLGQASEDSSFSFTDFSITTAERFQIQGDGFGSGFELTDGSVDGVDLVDIEWTFSDAVNSSSIERVGFSNGSTFKLRAGVRSEAQIDLRNSTVGRFNDVDLEVVGSDGSPSALSISYGTFADLTNFRLSVTGDASASLSNTVLFNVSGTSTCETLFNASQTIEGGILYGAHSIGPTAGSCAFANRVNRLRMTRQNGGQYYVPNANSPAVDVIPLGFSCSQSSQDQLGQPRPSGAACDVGAIERQVP